MRTKQQFTPIFPAWHSKLAPLGRRSAATARTLRHATLTQIEQSLGAALPQNLLGQNPSKDHSRERIFTLSRTVWCWIWQILQANTSCREVVRQVQSLFSIHDAGEVDEGTGAYCVARGKLALQLLKTLFHTSFKSAETVAKAFPLSLLQGRPIRVVDGSGTRLPDTVANRKAFPPSKSLPACTGFPYLRFVVLFSMASGALLAHAIGSLQSNELRLWLDLLPSLNRGDILLGDRAYGHYVVVALLQATGADLIATVPNRSRTVDFRRCKKRLARNDALFVWSKPKKCSALLSAAQWALLPKEITVRILRLKTHRPGFRPESIVLATTLLDPELYPAAEIIQAHARRWRLEMTLDDLKTTLAMESLSCRTPEMIHKELLVFLTAHNLIRWIMVSSALQENADLDRLSFKGALDAFRQWSQAMAICSRQKHRHLDLWRRLLRSIAADLVPLRPGRKEPRAVKKRSKYPPLNKPRAQYLGRPSRNKRRRLANAKKRTATN